MSANGEDAGSIFSEVRIRLDKLQSDISQAVNSIDKFGKNVVDMGNTASNLFSSSYSKSIGNVKTYLASLDDAVKSGALTQKQAIEQSIAVRKQEISFIQATAAQKGGFTAREIADLKSVKSELVGLESQYKELSASEKQTGQDSTRFSAASVAAAAVVAVAFRSLVSTASEYSAALAGVKAATRASADEMKQFASIADETAKTYGKTNTEALAGIEALAKAGVSTSDIIGGGLAGAMALAASGEMGVGDAAEAAAGIMTQFGKTGSDVVHIADLLSAAAGNAIGEVSDFTAAFKQVGLVSSKTGLSLEETTGTLAAFASNSLLGSDAGTSMKTMLSNLVPVSAEAGTLMKKLGFSAYDSKGAFVGISNVAEQLKTKLGGLTEAEKSEYLQTLFGNDGKRAAIVLMEQGGKGIDEWIGKVNQQGFAAETARIKMDSLDGDLQKLTASTTNMAASLGEAATPAMRGMAQVATFLLNALASLPGPVKVAIVTIGGLAGAVLAFAAAGPSVIGVIKGIGLAAATSLGPFGLIAAAVSTIAIGIGAAAVSAGAFETSTSRMIKRNSELIASAQSSASEFNKIIGPVNDVTRAHKLSSEQIDSLKKLYPELSKVMDLNRATIGDVSDAQKKLNEERNKDTLSAINNQIQRNNELIKKQTEFQSENNKIAKEKIDNLTKSDRAIISNYEATQRHTQSEREAYEAAKKHIDRVTELYQGVATSTSKTLGNTEALRAQNIVLLNQAKELDGTAQAARESQAVKDKAAADEKANVEKRKQDIEREAQSRKDLTSEYDKARFVYGQMHDQQLISDEDYYKKISSLASNRINEIEKQAEKDGVFSAAARDGIVKEMAIRSGAEKHIEDLNKKKSEQSSKEKELQSALDGTIESMIRQRDELINTGVMTEAQSALADKLSKKIIETQKNEAKATNATEEEKRKAQELTANFRQSYSDGLVDSVDREANKKKEGLDKEIKALRDANSLMLASDKEYADQSTAIAKYSAEQQAKIESDSLNSRIGSIGGFVNQVGGAFQGLLSALGGLYQAMSQSQLDSLDAQHQQLLDNLDADTQARLEAAGVDDQTAVESAQAQLDAAIAAGDLEAQSTAEKELKKQQILADAAAKKLETDKKYEHDKAQLQYKSSLEQWNLQMLNAIAGTAMAVISALSTQPFILGIALAAVAGIAGGIQIAAVAGAKPRPPALATGGMAIPGASGQGAQVIVAENGSPEMMLNGGASGEPFMNQFADKIASRIMDKIGGIGKDITIINELNSVVLAKAVAKEIENGNVRLRMG
jgi:TP901 family phage tail tape measure protein